MCAQYEMSQAKPAYLDTIFKVEYYDLKAGAKKTATKNVRVTHGNECADVISTRTLMRTNIKATVTLNSPPVQEKNPANNTMQKTITDCPATIVK